MANLATLVVTLGANSAKLVAGLKKSKSHVEMFAADVQKRMKSLKNVFNPIVGAITGIAKAAAAGAAVATGFVAALSMNARDIALMKNMADAIGVNVENLQKWQFAANRAGIAQEKVGDIFKDVSEKINDFITTGGGEAGDVFKSLGLDAKEFIGLAPDEALLRINDAMKDLNTGQKIFLLESLANDASLLIPLLDNNASKLKSLGNEAERLGLILNGKAVAGAKHFSDSMSTLTAIGSGFFKQLTAAVAPAIDVIIQKIISWVDEMGGVKIAALSAARYIVTGIKQSILAISSFIEGLKLIDIWWLKIRKTALDTVGVIAQVMMAFDPQTYGRLFGMDVEEGFFESIRNAMGDASIEVQRRINEMESAAKNSTFATDINSLFEGIDSALKSGPTAAGSLVSVESGVNATGKAVGQSAITFNENAEALKKWREELEFGIETLGKTADELEIYRARQLGAEDADIKRLKALQDQRNAMEYTLAIQEEFDRVLQNRNTQDATSALADYAKKANDVKTALQNTVVGGIKRLEDGLIGMIKGTKSAADAFKDMASSIIDDLIKIQIQKTITGPIASAIDSAGGVGGIFNNLFGTSFDGGGYTGFGSRSGGVDGKGGFPAILHPNETVVDHTKGQSLGGETVIVQQTINVSTGVQQTVRTEIASLMPQIAQASKAAVLDARRRGGSFASTFGAS